MEKATNKEEWISFNDLSLKLQKTGEVDPLKFTPIQKFINRDLSWLQFNQRVLNEASDPTVPPLERLRFIGITSSNLDEFFMVRVAQVHRRIIKTPSHKYPDGLHPRQLLFYIRQQVIEIKLKQNRILRQVMGVLSKEGIEILSEFESKNEVDKEVRSLLPEIKVILKNNGEPFPQLQSEKIQVYVGFTDGYAIINIENRAARVLQISSAGNKRRFVILDRWLAAKARSFFPNRTVTEAFPFKILRDADLRFRPDQEDQLEEQIIQALDKRARSKIIRLEVDALAYTDGGFFLGAALGVEPASLYRLNMPLDLGSLASITNEPVSGRLIYSRIKPHLPAAWAKIDDIFGLIKQRDIILHHPYDSFDLVVKYIEQAACDLSVTHIYHTLYRTSHESPIMNALKLAVKNGKHVAVYIELKARFDELNNVRWSNELRKAGVKVINPMGDYKVHCKMTLIKRTEEDQEISYLHLGTGNYHPQTARVYTDLGLLTRDPSLGAEAELFFKALAAQKHPSALKEILVAPGNLHKQFLDLIKMETDIQKAGGKGHIIAKMNSLVDTGIIQALYNASQSGVKIELLVRGICCLRPGIKGLSENIQVRSVIDRFLEHSRIYYFRSGGEKKVYLASADWMPRNFYTRYEMAFPIKDKNIIKFIREVILKTSWSDNFKSWQLGIDGNYSKVPMKAADSLIRSQILFERMSKKDYQDTALYKRKSKI